MKFKPGILHKGLAVIAIPLIFGIAFVWLISNGLTDAHLKFQRELMLKDAMICLDGITRRIFSARICIAANYASPDESFKSAFNSHMKESARSYKYLRNVLSGEKSLLDQMQPLKQLILLSSHFKQAFVSTGPNMNVVDMFGRRGVRHFLTNRPAFALMGQLTEMSGKEAVSVVESMKTLQTILIGGMVIVILLTIVMCVYFGRNISSRLLKIVDNTMRLSQGMPLSPPVSGSDEIAEYDQFLFKSATEIRDLERFKREMIGVVSHELKSPLSALEGFLSAFSAGIFGELSARARDRVERAHKNVKRLMALVKELLDLERIDTGKIEISAEQVSVPELVAASVDAVKELSEQKGVALEVINKADRVHADRDRLVQVFVNLLSNALKYSPPSGKVTIETFIDGPWLECRVSDQGRGIPESFRKVIFEPFKQVDATDATTKKGTGLGLTISRSIVEQHGGTIGVDSEEGHGSTFWFKIPVSGDLPISAGSNSLAEKNAGTPERNLVSVLGKDRAATGSGGRLSVMHKGLILISVPLIFELLFVSLITLLLYQIREQVHREENSKEIVHTLNHVAERLSLSSNSGMIYVATQDPSVLESWRQGRAESLQMLDRVKELAATDPEQKENIRLTDVWVKSCINVLDNMVASKETEFGELLRKSGFVEHAIALTQKQLGEERLLSREREKGEKLAAQREQMITVVNYTLSTGIVLNILLSIGLTIYLMRSITGRLHHVMDNTARLVKRADLLEPIKGSDEIAYLDQMLFQTGRRLVELENFKRELISMVSHELRTPLMSISSSLELLRAGALGGLTDKASHRLKIAQAETNRLIRLINNLLDLEKMEAGKFVLDTSDVKVAELVESAVAAVADLAEPRQIRLERSACDAVVKADRDRLLQVIINLLSNAIKFSPAGGVVSLIAELADSQVMFRVADKGRGIPADLQERIFDRFVQVEKQDASELGGSGLGLALAKSMVEQHGGKIGIDSRPGEGSTFWFTLPQVGESETKCLSSSI